MHQELNKMKRQLKLLTIYSIISTGVFLFIFASSFSGTDLPGIIRAKGIIIEDNEGRDRILIGSPVPHSKDRLRTDSVKVKEVWAKNSSLGSAKYMEHYRTYNHDASGIIFLNENGYDKLIVGDKTPDPNTGKRLVEPAGMTWNDDEGFERGGIGISKTAEGKHRVVMGMDDPVIGEAMHMFILEDGAKGLMIAGEDGMILIGKAKAGNEIFRNKNDFSGLRLIDNKGAVIWENNTLQKSDPAKKK
jgi:hypothetical protein